jgi:uncharacterized membrane protein
MLTNSNDLLNLILAICAVWLTVFICWLLFYATMILKKVNETMTRITLTLSLVDQLVTMIKNKINDFGKTIGAVVQTVSNISGVLKNKKTQSKK